MWVKVCGINQESTAAAVIARKPDAIGLNFYSKSKRCIPVEMARRIVNMLPREIRPIGLFVNHSEEEIKAICERCNIHTVQLHGDETPEFASKLREFEIIRAFRVGEEGLSELASELERYRELQVDLLGALVDAKVENAYGGTGHVAPWHQLAKGWRCDWPQLILAGGLTPGNVADAMRVVRPWGVDVASGVESSPGIQDPVKVTEFIREARSGIGTAT